MPVRDLEWYGGRLPAEAAPLRVLANRGANGIDGVVATALGAACAAWPRPVWLLIGDLALLHDSTSLLNAVHRRARVRLVVVDNGGGGIFSFLPQAAQVAPDRFEQLFGTTQRVAVEALLAAHGISTSSVAAGADLPAVDGLAAVDEPLAAVVVHVVDRSTNVEVHDRVHRGGAGAGAVTARGGATERTWSIRGRSARRRGEAARALDRSRLVVRVQRCRVHRRALPRCRRRCRGCGWQRRPGGAPSVAASLSVRPPAPGAGQRGRPSGGTGRTGRARARAR
ncbi:MAG: thiamine pyrophosphate-dependent enzyme [Acidimicrobiales bacterium]